MMAEQAILETLDVSKTYPRRVGVMRRQIGLIQAVDRVSLSVRPGERRSLWSPKI